MTGGPSEIRDQTSGSHARTLSTVRLRSDRTGGLLVEGGGGHDYVDLEVRTSAAARELRDLFAKLTERLVCAELAVVAEEDT